MGPRTRAASGGAIDAADDKRASVGAGGPASGPLGPGCHAACGEGGVFRGRGRDAAAAAIQPPATHGLAAHCHGSRDGSLNTTHLVIFDRVVFPVSRALDVICRRLFGKNVYLVARK